VVFFRSRFAPFLRDAKGGALRGLQLTGLHKNALLFAVLIGLLVHGAGQVLASPRTAASSALLISIFHTHDPLSSLINYCHYFIPTIEVHQIVTM
jgi:hypothetical protein